MQIQENLLYVSPANLKLGDIISTFVYRSTFESAIVVKIDELLVYLRRPYLRMDKFTLTVYTAYEDYTIYKSSPDVLYLGNNKC
jgi:hypothetical protein